MGRYITLSNNKIVGIRYGSAIVSGEIESETGELGQILQGDGTFIEDPTQMLVTLEQKIIEINTACNAAIEAGFDSTVKYGVSHRYTLRLVDQINMKTLYDECKAGATKVPWHYSGQDICEVWTNAEFEQFFNEAKTFVTQQRFYSDGLIAMARAADTQEELQAIVWGTPLTSEVQSSINAVIAELMPG